MRLICGYSLYAGVYSITTGNYDSPMNGHCSDNETVHLKGIGDVHVTSIVFSQCAWI